MDLDVTQFVLQRLPVGIEAAHLTDILQVLNRSLKSVIYYYTSQDMHNLPSTY